MLPRFLSPVRFVRKRIMRRGLRTDNQVLRVASLMLVGRPELVRGTAMRQGFAGRHQFWRVVAYGFIANDIRRKLTVKEPEHLGVERLVRGQSVTVSALRETRGRARKRS